MSNFICPVCKSKISLFERTYKCGNNHCFDLSKDGYVNLLMSQQSSLKRHGDDKLMVKARRDFLEKGFYNELRKDLCEALKEALPPNEAHLLIESLFSLFVKFLKKPLALIRGLLYTIRCIIVVL